MRTPRANQSSASKSFYKLMWPAEGPWGFAHGPSMFELRLYPNQEMLPHWSVPTFQVRNEPSADYQPNSAGLPLCSQKLRNILDAHRGAEDLIEWLPAEVREESKSSQYYILHFLEELDVLDLSYSMLNARGGVVKPHLSLAKVGEHKLFTYEGGGDLTICLAGEVQSEIEAAHCTCCHFWRMPAS